MKAILISLFLLFLNEININLNLVDETSFSDKFINHGVFHKILYNDSSILLVYKQVDTNCNFLIKNCKDTNQNVIVKIPDFILKEGCNRFSVDCIDIRNDSIFVLLRTYLIMYKMLGNEAILFKYINLEDIFHKNLLYYASNSLKIRGNKIYGLNENYHTKRDSTFYYWYYDIKEPGNSKFVNLPEPKGFYWTLFKPRQILDISEKEILMTDITEYSIKVKNLNSGKTDTLTRTIPNWKAVCYSTLKFKNRHPAQVINFFQNDTNTISTMNNIQFIDDNRIFVCYSFVNNDETTSQLYNLYYDIWERVNGKWVLTKSDIDSQQFSDSNENKVYSAIGNNYIFTKGKMITTHYDYEKEKGHFLIRELAK